MQLQGKELRQATGPQSSMDPPARRIPDEWKRIVAKFQRRFSSTYQAIQIDTRATDAMRTVAIFDIQLAASASRELIAS